VAADIRRLTAADLEGYMSGKTEFLLDLLRSAGIPDTNLITIRYENRRQ
jgi:hypothetical protein